MAIPVKAFRRSTTDSTYTARDSLTADDIISMAIYLLRQRVRKGRVLSSPETTRNFIQLQFVHHEEEVFGCLFLDSQHRVIAFEKLFFGTVDGASVYPRVVVKHALAHNAAAVIFTHNHPSGISEPSAADKRITERLTAALALVDIRVLDHMIVGHDSVTSFAERGLL